MIDIQMAACFNTHSPILHLFLPIQCQIHNMIEVLPCILKTKYRENFRRKITLFLQFWQSISDWSKI